MYAAYRDPLALKRSVAIALGITPETDDARAADSYQFALRSCWGRMEALLGPLGARAIVNRAIKVAARRYPLAGQVVVGDDGPDLAQLRAGDDAVGNRELHRCLEELCLGIFLTLAELTGKVLVGPLLEEMAKERPMSMGGQSGTASR